MSNNRKKFVKTLKFFNKLDLIERVFELDEISEQIVSNAVVRMHTQNSTNETTDILPSTSKHPAVQKQTPLDKSPIPRKRLNDATNPLEIASSNFFRQKYGFSKQTIYDILSMISYGLKKSTQRGQPVNPMAELLITLRFLRVGSIDSKNVAFSQPTICRIIQRVTSLLADLKLRFIKIPERNKFEEISEKFREIGGCPEVFGCIGSCHVPIKSPGKNIADDFLNENGFYSFRVVIICGPNLEFFELISRWPGGSQENKIFNISEMYQRCEYNKLDGILLANNRYICTNFVMTPVQVPTTPNETQYNAAHERSYLFPRAVALWKSEFKCLQHVLHHKEETIQAIITACAVLHNLAIQRNERVSSINTTDIDKKQPSPHPANNLPLSYPVIQNADGIHWRNVFIDRHFKI